MKAFLNPWILLGIVLGIGAAFVFGMQVGKDRQVATQTRLEQTLAEIERRTQVAVAEQIAAIEIKHVTIRAKTHEILRENLVYRDCVNEPDVVRLLDAARSGGTGAESVGDRKLP